MDNKHFSDIRIDVSITVARKTGGYSSDILAEVEVKETVSMTEPEIEGFVKRVAREAEHKAVSALGIRQAFEANIKALTAGSDVYDA